MATRYTDWKEYNDNGKLVSYRCATCEENSAKMLFRRAYEEDSTHTEYQIKCDICGKKSGLHWSKNVTTTEWLGHQDELDSMPRKRRKLFTL